MNSVGDNRIFASQGEGLPGKCPECDVLIPSAMLKNVCSCWNCGYTGEEDDFYCEWNFVPVQ